MSTAESCTVDAGKATFSAGQTGLTVANAATDILTIYNGTHGKKIKVLRVEVSGIATAAGTQPYSILFRSSANTGGTSTVIPGVPHESGTTATATVRTYTANPAGLGTLVGTIQAKRGTLLTATAASPASPTVFDFTTLGTKYPTLNYGETLALNFNAATAAGNALDVFINWTEE